MIIVYVACDCLDGKGFVTQSRQALTETNDDLQPDEELIIVDKTTSEFALVYTITSQFYHI